MHPVFQNRGTKNLSKKSVAVGQKYFDLKEGLHYGAGLFFLTVVEAIFRGNNKWHNCSIINN